MPESVGEYKYTMEPGLGVHPELHVPFPEQVDNEVTEWSRHIDTIADYSLGELGAWRKDFALVEHEHLQPYTVTIRTMATAAELLVQRAEESSDSRMRDVSKKLSNLVALLSKAINEYANSVRHHTAASEGLNLNENGETRLRYAYSLRAKAHEHVVDVLETHRQAMQTEVPEALDVAVMAKTEWQKLSTNAYMEKRNISTQGVRREQIGAWALDMDIAIKAGSLRELLTAEIEKRKTDAV